MSRVPPAGFEPANAAFGGLRPFHLATACCTRGRIRTCDEALNRRLRCHFATLIEEARRERTGRPGHTVGHHQAGARRWSTARESNPALLLGRQGPSRSDSGTGRDKRGSAHRESNPVPLTGSQACSHRHLARVELRAGLAPAWDEVAARRLSLRSSGAGRKREESNLRDTWSGRLATGCAKPTCTSLPSTSRRRAVATSRRRDIAMSVPPRRFERLSLDS